MCPVFVLFFDWFFAYFSYKICFYERIIKQVFSGVIFFFWNALRVTKLFDKYEFPDIRLCKPTFFLYYIKISVMSTMTLCNLSWLYMWLLPNFHHIKIWPHAECCLDKLFLWYLICFLSKSLFSSESTSFVLLFIFMSLCTANWISVKRSWWYFLITF